MEKIKNSFMILFVAFMTVLMLLSAITGGLWIIVTFGGWYISIICALIFIGCAFIITHDTH